MENLGLDVDPKNLSSNSHRSRSQDDISKKSIVNRNDIITTKKPLGKKFADFFMTEDADEIKKYLLFDIIIPGIKNTILDIMEMAFFGATSGRRGKSSNYYNYSSSYYGSSSSRSNKNSKERPKRDERVDYRHIVLRNREDAENIVEDMQNRIRKQGCASIADLLDLIGEKNINYNDNDWGWKYEKDVDVRRVSNGFLIELAKIEYLCED